MYCYAIMHCFLKHLIGDCAFLIGQHRVARCRSARFRGRTFEDSFPKEIELADQTPSKMTAEDYADYPLIVLSQEGKKKSCESPRTSRETIALRCRPVIMFWMCKVERRGTCARKSNRSQLSRIRLSASIWISTREFADSSSRRFRFSALILNVAFLVTS